MYSRASTGGNLLANGTWAVFGGNKAVGYGGGLFFLILPPHFLQRPASDSESCTWSGREVVQGQGPYQDYAGGTAIRLFNPCTDGSCQWTASNAARMQSERWYPTVETLQDGSLIIVRDDHKSA